MPHLIVEHSQSVAENVDIPTLIFTLHQAAIGTNTFQAASLKSRAVPVQAWCVGEQGGDFIHVEFRLLKGRTPEQKQAISAALLETLKTYASHIDSLTVEIRDMDDASYGKWLKG